MYKAKIEQQLKKIVGGMGFKTTDIVLSIPENPKFGDYSWNGPLQLAKLKEGESNHSSLEIANEILEHIGHPDYIERIEVAGPGFINFYLKDEALTSVILVSEAHPESNKADSGQARMTRKYLIEYGHTNPLKEVHIGHLRTFTLGESLARLLHYQGHEVFRANYQGDIGLHIAKAIWGIKKVGLPTEELNLEQKAKYMGQCYAEGSKSYEENPLAKNDIDQINLKLYQKDPEILEVYKLARDWSLEYFKPIYQLLGIKYDRCFYESEVYERGKQIILENIGKVFKEDDGAIIFPGEQYGLHNRVFITRAGNPTYEGKEIGLAELEYQSFPYDHSIHVVANEQLGYFEVVIKAIEIIFPNLKGKKQHLSFGFVDLKEGKMSSRTGNVITVDELVSLVAEKIRELMKLNSRTVDHESAIKIAVGAIKFAYLKVSSISNIVFDIEKSISLQGDSGPYLLYVYARIQSLINRATKDLSSSGSTRGSNDMDSRLRGNDKGRIAQSISKVSKVGESVKSVGLEDEEREVLRQLEYFESFADSAAQNFKPNELANYLLNLAKSFNTFYEKHPVLASDKSQFRLLLSEKVAEHIKLGLYLLGIETVERM